MLIPLGVWILLSGLDDLIIVLAWIYTSLRGRPHIVPPGDARLAVRERRIAIFVPLWREQSVIRDMLERNIAAIGYGCYHVFAGAYPNDDATLEVLRECEARFPRVHIAMCPHDGPTSKADCLNWIWRSMLAWEQQHGIRFEMVVLHDAEDVIHSEELRWANYYTRAFDMIQVPVLPLATAAGHVTHGVYCDEFAEYQTKDIPARQALGGFIPSNGVGTAYSRRAMDAMAASGAPFDAACLTEDYDSGYRLRRSGYRQLFIPIHRHEREPAATREYFPSRGRDAIRQRTRWVIGIVLQSWERHGWGRGWLEAYWFLRDRKGLVGNPASLLSNAIAAYIAVMWTLGQDTPPGAPWFIATLALQTAGLASRMYCCGRIYGWGFAAGAPLRALWANWLNASATGCALWRYFAARLRDASLAWSKTDHVYPRVCSDDRAGCARSGEGNGGRSLPVAVQ